MRKVNCYILPEEIERVIENGTLSSHVFKLENFAKKMQEWTQFVKLRVRTDLSQLEAFQDFDLLEMRTFLSLFLDFGAVFCPIEEVSNTEQNSYYLILRSGDERFKKLNSMTHIHIIETFFRSDAETLKIMALEDKEGFASFLRLSDSYPYQNPKLCIVEKLPLDTLALDLFFQEVIRNIIQTEENFRKFKLAYYHFYKHFDWKNWNVVLNPCPAHEVLKPLQEYHSRRKDNPYLFDWGSIMAVLNGSKFNKALTELNASDPRVNHVFQSGGPDSKSIIFFSIDGENGTLEMYDYKGDHLNKIYGLKSGIRNQNRSYKIKVPTAYWLV